MAQQFREDITPETVTKWPIGTLDELQADGLDPSAYHSCSRPGPGNLGCPLWRKCRMSFKGTAGPLRGAFEEVKGRALGGAISVIEADCMWAAKREQDILANGGSLTMIAGEGEEYEVVEHRPHHPVTRKPIEWAEHPKPNMLPVMVKHTVKPFPRPGDSIDVVQDLYRARKRKEAHDEVAGQARKRALGVPDTTTLDGSGRKRRAGKDDPGQEG